MWLTGHFGFNFLFCLLSLFCYLHCVDPLQKERLKLQMKHRLQLDSIQKERATGGETVLWLNSLLKASWPCWLERYLSNVAIPALTSYLNCCKPTAMRAGEVSVSLLRLVASPPFIHSVNLLRSNSNDLALEMDVSFVAAGDMKLGIATRRKRALRRFGVRRKLHGHSLVIEGKLRLGCSFGSSAGNLFADFVCAPKTGLGIQTVSLKGVDKSAMASWVVRMLFNSFCFARCQPQGEVGL